MKKIISIFLIILISNYSFSCYSSQQAASEETWVYDGQNIASVITKDGREIKFLFNSGRYVPEERAITGIASIIQSVDSVMTTSISLDDVMWVKVRRFDGVKTTIRITLFSGAFFALLAALALASFDPI